ncbi:MAG: efflux RND transporter periplasmic adaptor subunit [Halieaceae bacterium]|jgi:membrane fusion protein (multidrug efflux system)|nr:efflux RND transporter periplasmic adaptor subunit [Halieaceae bacterium]
MRAVLFVLVAVGIGVGAWYYVGSDEAAGRGRPAMGPVPVTGWVLEEQPFQSRVEALGTLRAWESVTITASVSENVAKLHFEDGQQVKTGDLLVTLQQEEEKASLREQQEFLAEQEREVARLVNLARSNQVAQTDLDQRRTQAAIARSRIEQEKAQIDDRTIKAPFDGVLGLRQVSPGALVAPGEVITTLDDISRMRLDFTVPARFLRFLQPGQQIEASTAAYVQAFTGEIAAVSSRVDPVNRSVTARAVFPNDDGLLKPGMLMSVTVLGDQRNALLVPEESLVSRSTDHYVWQINGDIATRVFVEIGDRRPGWVEVLGGLQPGDQVVRDGVGRLRGNESAVRVLES